jgi:carbonic anhydrase/acetyltransferase-like protein (isoleucine patch superfamily)
MPIYEFDGKKPLIAPDTFVHPTAVIIGAASIGSQCYIAPSAVIRADFGTITIGDGSSIQDNVTIHVNVGGRVAIGRNAIIGHNAVLHDVMLHDHCMIGIGAVLLSNVVCEEGVVVAAGSLLLQGVRIPAGRLVMGNPARIIKEVPEDLKMYAEVGTEQYKELTALYLRTMKEIPR